MSLPAPRGRPARHCAHLHTKAREDREALRKAAGAGAVRPLDRREGPYRPALKGEGVAPPVPACGAPAGVELGTPREAFSQRGRL